MRKYFYLVVIFILDLVLKQIALQTSGIVFIIPKIFAFKFFKNLVLAFSISFPQVMIITLSIIILLTLALLVYKKRYYFFPASLVFLGAASNLFDRLYHGFVIDYFYLYPISYFNLADLLIILGALWFIFSSKKTLKSQ